MADKPDRKKPRALLLALGLILSFMFCSVMFLSSLPVDPVFDESQLASDASSSDFQFYDLLKKQDTENREVQEIASAQRVIPVDTRVVPGNSQMINQRTRAAENYAEIPASSIGQESYYLQAGNFVSPADAERASMAVRMLGLDAFVVQREVNGRVGHRVRIGPYFDEEMLNDAKQRLRRGSIDFKIIRVAGFRDPARNDDPQRAGD
ncbi:MAG: hypothetical protein CSA54_03115 [Gammaproteobacteria bacterium]|nr:MAG: hypothetical protein CSA54_03115 [Gammaproteobacteria bacterium]